MKLPLKFVNVNYRYNNYGYTIEDSNEYTIINSSWFPEDDVVPDESVAVQLVQAANNFPEAVRLLKELEDFLDYAGYSFNDTLFSNRAKEINNFLTKLEDETTK